jgi:hypothetical protein
MISEGCKGALEMRNGPVKKISKKRRLNKKQDRRDPGLRLAIKAVGGSMTHLAGLLGIRPQAVAQWDEIPMRRVPDVEHHTGIDREKLRPDLYKRKKRR